MHNTKLYQQEMRFFTLGYRNNRKERALIMSAVVTIMFMKGFVIMSVKYKQKYITTMLQGYIKELDTERAITRTKEPCRLLARTFTSWL